MMDPNAAAFDGSYLTTRPPPSDDATPRVGPSTVAPPAPPSPLDVPVAPSMYPQYPPIGPELDLAYHQRHSSGGTTDSVETPSIGYSSVARSSPVNEPYISSPAAFWPRPTFVYPFAMYHDHAPASLSSNNSVPPPWIRIPIHPPPPPGNHIHSTFGAGLHLFPDTGDCGFYPAPPLPPPGLEHACPPHQASSVGYQSSHHCEAMKVSLEHTRAELTR